MLRYVFGGWALVMAAAPARGDCIAFVEARVHARNAKAVCETMREFGEPKEFETHRVGPAADAPVAYIFMPEWGNGLTGTRPSYHFKLRRGELVQIFATTSAVSYSDNVMKGRYLLYQHYYFNVTQPKAGEEDLGDAADVSFWDGARYQRAYTISRTRQKDGREKSRKVVWEPMAQQQFKATCLKAGKTQPRLCEPGAAFE
jgi:hypothetical protein